MPSISTHTPAENGGPASRPTGGSQLVRCLALATLSLRRGAVRPEVPPSAATTVEPTLNTAPRG
jgi:hypothetical protein